MNDTTTPILPYVELDDRLCFSSSATRLCFSVNVPERIRKRRTRLYNWMARGYVPPSPSTQTEVTKSSPMIVCVSIHTGCGQCFVGKPATTVVEIRGEYVPVCDDCMKRLQAALKVVGE